MPRIFLDANILFSAAYRETNDLLKLWTIADIELLSSAYAVEEARRNLQDVAQRERLSRLVQRSIIVPEATAVALPASIALPTKDLPILQAAVNAGASHLLTGDRKHFGRYYGQTVAGVRILSPGMYLRRK